MKWQRVGAFVNFREGTSKKGAPFITARFADTETYETAEFLVAKEFREKVAEKLKELSKGELVEITIDIQTERTTFVTLVDIVPTKL